MTNLVHPSQRAATDRTAQARNRVAAAVLGAALSIAIAATGCSLDSANIPSDPVERDIEVVRVAQHGTHGRLRALIEAGGNAAQRDDLGWTPLHYAINRFRNKDYDELRVVEVLLEAPGVDVQARTNSGDSPITLAAEHGNIELLELLLANGADLEYRESDSFTVLTSALRRRQLAMARHLLDKGVDVNEPLKGGGSALFIALRSRDQQAVQMLIDANVDIHGGGKAAAPVIFAAALRDVELMKLLLDAGADVNAVNPTNGLTALHRAVGSGSEMVKLLLDAGARGGVVDKEGHTPLDLANELGDESIIALLGARLTSATPQ
ncbi:MAG: ankyrin repeat domain-containing protein [Myxococcota bacterium]|jgi:ankyrin repeat protein|nr:ankyrin repeat domain-containing protein [Myxococcota bacterium]